MRPIRRSFQTRLLLNPILSQRTHPRPLPSEPPNSASHPNCRRLSIMRRFLNVLFILSLGAAVTATLLRPDHVVTHPLQLSVLIIAMVIVLDRIFGWFKPKRGTNIPRSLVGEIEQLYFRCMREMLSDNPNV